MSVACRAAYVQMEHEKAEWVGKFKRQLAANAAGQQSASDQFRATVDAMAAEQEAQRLHLKVGLPALPCSCTLSRMRSGVLRVRNRGRARWRPPRFGTSSSS